MAIKLTKTLFVGLGGTGVKSILRTKQCFVDAYGEVPPMIAFLAIDTDKGIRNSILTSRSGKVVKLEEDEICFCGMSGSALSIYNFQQSRFVWLPKRNVNNLAGLQGEGAGQVRSNGRFLIRFNSDNIGNSVAGKVAQIARPLPFGSKFDYDKNTEGMEYPTMINIVGSVAGGTGSGTIIDMIVLTAEKLKSQGIIFKIQPWIVLPEVFKKMVPGPPSASVYQNTYGALRELDYLYHLPKNNTNPLDFGFTQINYLAEEVNDTFLLNNANRSGVVLQSIDDITDSIGRCMFLPSNEVNSVTDNVKQVRFVYSVSNKEAHYKSSGSAELVYDNQAVGNVIARAIISDICDELCRRNSLGAEVDVNAWMSQVRIQEHDEDMLTDDLLSKSVPFSVSIGKDTDVSYLQASIFSGAEAQNVQDEIQKAYTEKLQEVKSAFSDKLNSVLNQQCGVGDALAFIDALEDSIDICMNEMNTEKEDLTRELAYPIDWNAKLSELKPSFWKPWPQDDADALSSEVSAYIAKKRDLLRHTFAIQFYTALLDEVSQFKNKITLLKTNIESVARKQIRDINTIQHLAAENSKFQLFLHSEDVQSYSRPDVRDTSAQLRSLYSIFAMLGETPETIEHKMWSYAKNHDDVKNSVNVTIEQKLAAMDEDTLKACFAKMKEMSSPLWTTNTRGYLDHAQPLTTVFTIGCFDSQVGIIQNRFKNEFTVNNNEPIFATTRQTDRITFFQTECYVPVYAVNNMPGYKDDAERKLNIEKQFPVCYLDEKWFQRMEVEKFDIFPQKSVDNVLPNWVNAIVYGYVKYDETAKTYYIMSKQGNVLKGGYLALGERRDIAFDAFQTRGLEKEVEEKIAQEINDKGRPAVVAIFQSIKNDTINYVPTYAMLSSIELDRVNAEDPTYQMVTDQLVREIEYINNLVL